jgi:hypothetical protein
MFAGLPPSSSELTERKSVVPPSPPAHSSPLGLVLATLAPLFERSAARTSRIYRRRRRSHRIARRRAAEERDDTLLVGERRQSRRLPGAIRSERQRAIRQRKERLRSLLIHCSLRSLRLALTSPCLPHSLADEKRVRLLARPGQRRASLAPCGGARFPTLAAERAQLDS